MAGIGPQGDEQRKAAIARKWNIDIATPSRKLKRTSVVVVPEALWDSMKELEGTPITRKQFCRTGLSVAPRKWLRVRRHRQGNSSIRVRLGPA